ncbi:MAG: Heme/hemopexin-binding protein [Herbaspirillum frisingense]|uniref:Heme/hemopexin-binding protein n=1 Tax=Herbaspirillum frisingense TaxID=92645 RepID=A0A7V8JUJ6_9BURK|nr:MAG: Heme/hemopexin-binding protein [Herbaspirillum frisingense]
MNKRGCGAPTPTIKNRAARPLHRAPIAQAVALLLAAGAAPSLFAQQAFSPAWFASKGATQNSAATTGYLPNGTPASLLTNPSQQQQQANAQLQRSINNLSALARGIAAQQAAQEAARQAALANGGSVPDGLADGGLKVDTHSLTRGWINASAPTQSTANGKTMVAIQQTADRAILNWESFNVGKNTVLTFLQQPAWAVLNRVNDPLARPSQIQGQISGNGTVMIVNRNGVVFAGSSQVDTRNLVAAAASISDSQFTRDGIYGSDARTPSFTDANGRLIVEAGARLGTALPESVTSGGGYVLLLGTEVHNAGQIATARGQAGLAAGDSFVIRKGVASDANTFSTTRGAEIAPGIVAGSGAGKAVNDGLITAAQGDITLAGRDVQQNGVVVSSTTADTRGTIHLLNAAGDAAGKVTLGANASTAVVIEDDGKSTVLNSKRDALIADSSAQDILRQNAQQGVFDNLARLPDRRDQSRIEIVSGGSVSFEPGSMTLATGGQIAVAAGGRSQVASGASLDVAGAVGVRLAMESNNLKINIQGNELRDAPAARDAGKLANGDVWIDTRQLLYVAPGTGGYESERWYTAGGLLEAGGYLANQGHRVSEWAAQGGVITLGGREVITQSGSSINLAGGSLDVQTGYLNVSWLKGNDGRLYNANTARSDQSYGGVYKGFEVAHARWGDKTTEYYTNPLIAPQRVLQAGYTVGRDAGTLVLNTRTAVIEGAIDASVYNGPGQIRARTGGLADGYKQVQTAAARAGTLALGRYNGIGRGDLFDSDVRIGDVARIAAGLGLGDTLDAVRDGTVWLDAAWLNAQQLGGLDLGTRGAISVTGAISLADGGRMALTAPGVIIAGNIGIRSGSLRVTDVFTSANVGQNPLVLVNPDHAGIVVRDGVAIDLRGVQPGAAASANAQAFVGGGSVTLDSARNVTLAAGSSIDVSGGATLTPQGKAVGGKGGSISLAADSMTVLGQGGKLQLDGVLRGFGVGGGGTLSLETAGRVLIGSDGNSVADALNLDVNRFQSGFSVYDINGHGGLEVQDGARLEVAAPVLQIHGVDQGAPVLSLWTPPVYVNNEAKQSFTQRSGADLILRSQRLQDGADIRIGRNALVAVDPGRAISLLGGASSNIEVQGRLNAWSGNIVIDLADDLTKPNRDATGANRRQAIWIGENAVLDTAARAVSFTAADGRRYGAVANGGSIAIGGVNDWDKSGTARAPYIAIVVRPGALLDASGAAASFDYRTGQGMQTVDVASNGGSIVFKTMHSLYLDGAMSARAGGAGAAGGTLGVALETPVLSRGPFAPGSFAQREFFLTQNNTGSALAADAQLTQTLPLLQAGFARLGVNQVSAGGFDNLSLLVNGLLGFDGNLDLRTAQSLRVTAAAFNLAESAAIDSQVKLASSYVALSGATTAPGALGNEFMASVNWRSGASLRDSKASLAVSGDLVDVRDRVGFGGVHGDLRQETGPAIVLDRRGFADVAVTSTGDVRLLGGKAGMGLAGTTTTELAGTGNLTLTAAQIYPVTSASAQIVSGYDANDVLAIRRYADLDPATPASVFGTLALGGGQVLQGGIVRAPLGQVALGVNKQDFNSTMTGQVQLLPGSITSVSATGLALPYGGTTDGLSYKLNGQVVQFPALGTSKITFAANSVIGQAGSLLDLSGGGTLSGAGFITGRGGSVDVLRTPLANGNPTNTFSAGGNAVYAIVPAGALQYAPVLADVGAGAPLVGQQINLQQDVGGLKAGTYTLLPSTFALLPGAYRIEIGKQAQPGMTAVATGTGSVVGAGYLGVANTAVRASLPNQIVVTPGAVVRQLSSYNETGYDAFVRADAARRGGVRGQLALDAHDLVLDLGRAVAPAGQPLFRFNGDARFTRGGSDAFGGTLFVTAGDLQVLGPTGTPSGAGNAVVYAGDLNAIGASRMVLGGELMLLHGDNFASLTPRASQVTLRDGAVLRAPEVFLLASNGIVVEQGAAIDTLGRGAVAYDSNDGVLFRPVSGGVLAVSHGWINLLPTGGNGARINVGACALAPCGSDTRLVGEGTVALATDGNVALGDAARFGARNVVLAVSSLNMGENAALDSARANHALPAGLTMNEAVLNRLLAGERSTSVPAVENLFFNVLNSVNLYGNFSFDTGSASTGAASLQQLVFSAPAIYGYGATGERASINAREIVWTGTVPTTSSSGDTSNSTRPGAGAAIADRLGDGALALNAERIVLGYAKRTQPLSNVASERLILGFGNVALNAAERLVANNNGSLSVYQYQGAYDATTGYAYSGGNLAFNTPLITAEAGAVMRVKAGGDIVAQGPATAATSNALGAEWQLAGRNVTIDTRVALPSGRLVVSAENDVMLGNAAQIDLAGRAIGFFEQTRYSQGGDLALRSSAGNITQAGGSVIDVSAVNNAGGTMEAVALGAGAGVIRLAGVLKGSASGQYDAGGTLVPFDAAEFTARAQTVSDFADLNARLTAGGVFGARRFQIKQGDLTVGDELKARTVEVSVDGGSLNVNGRIDASGFQVGTIRLAARDNLNLNGMLDAHGTGMRLDSYGAVIDAANRAVIDLTSIGGNLNVAAGARIDLRSGTAAGNDGVARGSLSLNAARVGADDVALNVAGAPLISGARSIAVNAFRTYDDAAAAPADANGRTSQLVTQAYLDTIDGHSRTYINAALANTALRARLAGLGDYHLRPGVEIVSNAAVNPSGDLTVLGDIDLSNYRYGPQSDPGNTALRGFGEPGVLVLRAKGNLNIYGSINDGFAPPPTTPDEHGWYLTEIDPAATARSSTFSGDIIVPRDGLVTLDAGTVFPQGATLNYAIDVNAMMLPSGTVLPSRVTLAGNYELPAGVVVAANVYNADNSLAVAKGSIPASAIALAPGMKLDAGTRLRSNIDVAAMTWPKGVALPTQMVTAATTALQRGALIPGLTKIQLVNDAPVDLRADDNGIQGRNWAVAPMLPRGTSSWSMQFTAGSDLGASDRRATVPGAVGSVVLADAHFVKRTDVLPGGTGYVWSAGNIYGMVPGTPIDDDWSNGIDCAHNTTDCAIDPKRINATWTLDGANDLFADPSYAGKPVEPFLWEAGYCDWAPNYCIVIINPVQDVLTTRVFSPLFSVLRTGTGDIGIHAARDIDMRSPFGVYTAGTQSAPVLNSLGADAFQLARGTSGGSIPGLSAPSLSAALATYQAWYPELGGNLIVSAGRDITGDVWGQPMAEQRKQWASAGVGNWLWRQGSGAIGGADAVASAWWINFGSYVWTADASDKSGKPYVAGFTGLGTLGGGNLSVSAGGDAGVINGRGDDLVARSDALVTAVGGSGRVTGDGKMILTGGGDLRIRVAGTVNPNAPALQSGLGGNNIQNPDLSGAIINLRGASLVDAGSIGDVRQIYRTQAAPNAGYDIDLGEVRAVDPFVATLSNAANGVTLMPGDSAVTVQTRRDLVIADAGDAGRVFIQNSTPFSVNGVRYEGGGTSGFSLWTPQTAINLFSAGGNLVPGMQAVNGRDRSLAGNGNRADLVAVYPSILRATAASGSIYYGYGISRGGSNNDVIGQLMLAPSARGRLEMLAGTGIYGGNYAISMSNADIALPSPLQPAFIGAGAGAAGSNMSPEGTAARDFNAPVSTTQADAFPLFAFGPDTATAGSIHAGDHAAALFYARSGDIMGLTTGVVQTYNPTQTGRSVLTWYRAALPARILAGGDIVNAKGLFVHNNLDDVSLVQAGGDIIYADVKVAGPGTLEVNAGRNVRQENKASLVSLGGIVPGDARLGADIAVMAGMANGVDFDAIAQRYLDPANQANPTLALAGQPGKVVKTYNAELERWLGKRFGFAGKGQAAVAYFRALAPEQQRAFLRTVYYSELREGGREYNDTQSLRFGSYLRGRDMIATLFPDSAADGSAIRRTGDITLFGDAGVHTNFGGDIQMLAPGGQIVVGVQGPVPAASAGLITQGQGNIQLFSERSLLLGLSRIMTTFGGDILAWTEQGDINAGRGSKTTQIYTPPKRVYDQWGNVTLSPQTPSSGAGIATLAPIAEAAAGDVDLIAPLGTIDAGEAGIRVSGNVNIAALAVVNAANIQVQGKAAGLPVVAAVNVGALTNASAAASSAAMAAQDAVSRDRAAARQSLPSVFTVRVLGFGADSGAAAQPVQPSAGSGYDRASFVQVAGHGQALRPELASRLTEAEKRSLREDR